MVDLLKVNHYRDMREGSRRLSATPPPAVFSLPHEPPRDTRRSGAGRGPQQRVRRRIGREETLDPELVGGDVLSHAECGNHREEREPYFAEYERERQDRHERRIERAPQVRTS